MIELRNVTRTYTHGSSEIRALAGISLAVKDGEFVSVMGPSGSGKSTLLNLIGGLDQPSGGEIFIDRTPLHNISDDELTLVRRRRVGFIFQFFNLLPVLTATENVCLPLLLEGERFDSVRSRGEELLAQVGLSGRTGHRPEELSGGEMQRVAIARALITKPAVLLADEPTGNLDSKTSDEIFTLLGSLNKDGQTIVMVTHDPRAASRGSRIVTLRDGLVEDDRQVKTL